ncbi:MAG: phosphotransferase family protein [Thiohalocapsa sp.]
MPLPPFDPAPLTRFLATASGAERVEIGRLELLPGGAIRENWGFTAVFAGGRLAGAQPLVLRTDGPTGIASSLTRIEEFALLRAVHAPGMRVPEPLFACADPGVIGKPFFVMRRLPGKAQGRLITTEPAVQPVLPAIAYFLGGQLARLQRICPPRADLAFLPMVGPAEHIASFRAYLDGHPNPRPVLEWAIRWLEKNIPDPLPPVLCHRDFRTGNYLIDMRPVRGDRPDITGILDWEFAGWGDPDEDIGWFCCKGWRFARLDREAGGIAARDPFYTGYESIAGRRPDPRRVHFWEVLANVRWAVIALQQSDRHLVGGARDLSTAIIGRRATECDLELLLLLDPEGAATRKTPSPPSGERVGVRGQAVEPPSPSQPCGLGASLSRNAGEGLSIRDLPGGAGLLALAREELLGELLSLLPPERERQARLIATAMAIAERELTAGDAPDGDIAQRLAEFYGVREQGLPLPRRLAADLRAGAFEPCRGRERQALAVLWTLTMQKLREANPGFLAANGFGD